MLTFDDDEVTGPASVYDPTGADSRRGAQVKESTRSPSKRRRCAAMARAARKLARRDGATKRFLAQAILLLLTLFRGRTLARLGARRG